MGHHLIKSFALVSTLTIVGAGCVKHKQQEQAASQSPLEKYCSELNAKGLESLKKNTDANGKVAFDMANFTGCWKLTTYLDEEKKSVTNSAYNFLKDPVSVAKASHTEAKDKSSSKKDQAKEPMPETVKGTLQFGVIIDGAHEYSCGGFYSAEKPIESYLISGNIELSPDMSQLSLNQVSATSLIQADMTFLRDGGGVLNYMNNPDASVVKNFGDNIVSNGPVETYMSFVSKCNFQPSAESLKPKEAPKGKISSFFSFLKSKFGGKHEETPKDQSTASPSQTPAK